MVIVNCIGGLGNQLFQYAFYCALRKRIGCNVKLYIEDFGKLRDGYERLIKLENMIYPDAITYIAEDEYRVLVEPRLNLSGYEEFGCKRILKYSPTKLVQLMDGEEFESCGFKIKMILT